MANDQLHKLLQVMPEIAETVNRFASPTAQVYAFRFLVVAADVDFNYLYWDHPGLRWGDPEDPLVRSSIRLDELLDEEQLLDVNRRLIRAEHRAAERSSRKDDPTPSFDAAELRKLAERAAAGEPVSLDNQ